MRRRVWPRDMATSASCCPRWKRSPEIPRSPVSRPYDRPPSSGSSGMQDHRDRLPPAGRPPRMGRIRAAIGQDLGVDLGTANTLIYLRGRGVVLAQPSYVAIDVNEGTLIGAGEEAREMLGRAPAHIEVIRPLQSGVISDLDAAQAMLREFILRVHHRRRIVKPRVVVCVPSGVTMIERRAVEEAVLQAGARHVEIVSEPLA